MGCCQMMFAQTLHNDREKCDRKVLKADDVSACYTCYTCDKSGEKKICETCALKNHLDHDIHLVGYLSFDCSEKQQSSEEDTHEHCENCDDHHDDWFNRISKILAFKHTFLNKDINIFRNFNYFF